MWLDWRVNPVLEHDTYGSEPQFMLHVFGNPMSVVRLIGTPCAGAWLEILRQMLKNMKVPHRIVIGAPLQFHFYKIGTAYSILLLAHG